MKPYFLTFSIVSVISVTLFSSPVADAPSARNISSPADQDPPLLVREGVPQLTDTTQCEVRTMLDWVCRDGNTVTAAQGGKPHLFKLGPDVVHRDKHLQHTLLQR